MLEPPTTGIMPMTDYDDDSALLRKQKHFLQQVEMELRRTNRDSIHRRIPQLNRDSFLRFATFVAEQRTSYLQVALELAQSESGSAESERLLAALRERRLAFEESRDAFAALERTIEQGYVDIGV
jgi:hypothetical protein